MTWRLASVFLAAFVSLLASCGSPLVGSECRTGFELCGGRCVDVRTDRNHCGGCGEVCGAGLVCQEGACGTTPMDGGAGDDAGDAAMPSGCRLGEALCGDICVRPSDDDANCGGCGVVCDGVCANGFCSGSCELPLLECGLACVSPTSHPNHCGGCNRRCASGVCRRGECVEASAGHVVVIGHDYRGVPTGRQAINRVLGNAVYLADGVPIRILAFQEATHPAGIAGVERALEQVRVERGRSYEVEVATGDLVPYRLEQADVLLILAQHSATDARLRELGQDWASALRDFVATGGVVVLLDGSTGNEGTYQLLEPAGLFTATGAVSVPPSSLEVTSLGQALAIGLPEMYGAEQSTVRFETSDETVIVRHASGPVVIHRIVRP